MRVSGVGGQRGPVAMAEHLGRGPDQGQPGEGEGPGWGGGASPQPRTPGVPLSGPGAAAAAAAAAAGEVWRGGPETLTQPCPHSQTLSSAAGCAAATPAHYLPPEPRPERAPARLPGSWLPQACASLINLWTKVFNPYHNPQEVFIQFSPFPSCRWGNQGTEGSSHLTEGTQGSGRQR